MVFDTTQKYLDSLTESELAAHTAADKLGNLRIERNRLLAETDWWANSDITMTTEQTNYRQALRDITESATSLDDVTWGTKP